MFRTVALATLPLTLSHTIRCNGTSGTPCPDDTICVTQFPYTASHDTQDGSSVFDEYSCASWIDESGPENVFRIDVDEPGFLATTLWGSSSDIDVHILQSRDSADCLDRGDAMAGAFLSPGTYYIVADSWNGSPGTYNIRIHFTETDAFEGDGLDPDVLETSLRAFGTAWSDDQTDSFVYTVADFSLPSSSRRLWTFDLASGDLLFNEYVAHGEGSSSSDIRYVESMSNVSGSHESSIGLMRAAETYWGSNGYSLRLDGLESGYNHRVRSRAIVIHGADYSAPGFVNAYGFTGESWGCPAVDHAVNTELIDTIKHGGLYMSYFDDAGWLANSAYL